MGSDCKIHRSLVIALVEADVTSINRPAGSRCQSARTYSMPIHTPGEATYWTAPTTAKAARISVSSLQRISHPHVNKAAADWMRPMTHGKEIDLVEIASWRGLA